MACDTIRQSQQNAFPIEVGSNLGVFDDAVFGQPVLTQDSVLVRPIPMEFFFGQSLLPPDPKGQREHALRIGHSSQVLDLYKLLRRK